MTAFFRVAIIGAGVAGSGLAYHLAKLGWTDVVLIEKDEIASGASAYAAGNLNHFAESPLIARLALETTALYPRLEAETGQSVGWHNTGSLRLANTGEQMTDYRRRAAEARLLGMPFEVIGAQQVKALCPLIDTAGVVGAAWTPADGYIDPASVTNAFAKGARMLGVTVMLRTQVRVLEPLATGDWRVVTDKGEVRAAAVVNAGGWFAREVSRLAGHDLPMTLHEHQYMLTERIPEIADLGQVPMLRDLGAPFYSRQEGQGLLVSAYEAAPRFVAVGGVPADFCKNLPPPHLDLPAEVLERIVARLPCLATTGIKRMINAPVMRSPDGEPMLGPVPGLRNFWVSTAFGAGFITGSVSKYLARWIVDGDPGIDLAPLDLRRFGDWANQAFTYSMVRARHSYSTHVVYPHAERMTGRPLKTGPLYDRQRAKGAVFGVRGAWEVPLWFAPAGTEAIDQPSFRRANWFEPVGAEVRAVHERAGLADLSSLCAFAVEGPGAAAFLDRLCAARLPNPGAAVTSPILTPKGGVAAVLTLARLDKDRFQLTSWAQAEPWIEDILRRANPEAGVVIANVSAQRGTFLLVGPAAPAILASFVDPDLTTASFPAGAARETRLGPVPVRLLRVRDLGEIAYEIHHGFEHAVAIAEMLARAGREHGMVDFGLRALLSLRIETAQPLWGIDVTAAMHVIDAGLAPLCAPDKGEFVGCAALDRGPAGGRRLVCLSVASGDADANGFELVSRNDRPVGMVTSGWYGWRAGRSLAFAHVDAECAAPGTHLTVEILGEAAPAEVTAGPVYDPAGAHPAA